MSQSEQSQPTLSEEERKFLLEVRNARLMEVAAIEKRLGMKKAERQRDLEASRH